MPPPHSLTVLQAEYRLDAIVTLVDAKHVQLHLDDEKPEGVENEVCVNDFGHVQRCNSRHPPLPNWACKPSCSGSSCSLACSAIRDGSGHWRWRCLSLPNLSRHLPHAQAVEQIAFADKILLNKVDLVTETEKAEVIRRIKVCLGMAI